MQRILGLVYPITIPDNQFTVTGSADASKLLTFEVDTQGAGFTFKIDVGAQTTSRTLLVPVLAGTDTIATLGVANTFTQPPVFASAGASITGAGAAATAEVSLSITRTGHTTAANRCVFITSAGSDFFVLGQQGSSDNGSIAWATANTSYLYAPSRLRLGTGTNASAYAEFISAGNTLSAVGTAGIVNVLSLQTVGNAGANRGFSIAYLINNGASSRAGGNFTVANDQTNPTTATYTAFSTEIASAVAERVRISGAGNLLVGTTADTGLTGASGLSIASTTDSTSTTTGAQVTAGGIGFGVTKSIFGGGFKSTSATLGIGYATGAGAAVTQLTSRVTGVTINNICGAITLFSVAGSAAYQTFTVTSSAVAATDVVRVCQKSGTDLYEIHVTAITAGTFNVTFRTTGGTTVEQPVFNFAIIKAVAA